MAAQKTQQGKAHLKLEESTKLSVRDIRHALEASGYPLEVRLYNLLAELGARPVLGSLVPIRDGELREIDLIATAGSRFATAREVREGETDTRSTRVQRQLVVAVKKLHAPKAIVGIRGAHPGRPTLRSLRARGLGGVPGHGVRHPPFSDLPATVIAHDFGRLLDLGEVRVCPHWVIARRKAKTFEPFADGGQEGTADRYAKDFERVCLAAFALARQHTKGILNFVAPTLVAMTAFQPVLVVDTPRLYVYDPASKRLITCPWLLSERASRCRRPPTRSHGSWTSSPRGMFPCISRPRVTPLTPPGQRDRPSTSISWATSRSVHTSQSPRREFNGRTMTGPPPRSHGRSLVTRHVRGD